MIYGIFHLPVLLKVLGLMVYLVSFLQAPLLTVETKTALLSLSEMPGRFLLMKRVVLEATDLHLRKNLWSWDLMVCPNLCYLKVF